MNKDSFKIFENIASSSFEDYHAGLHTMLRNHEYFAKHVERNYRVKKFNEEHEFYMTTNERHFHFIGFMDAILWLSRADFLDSSTKDEDSDEDYELTEDERKIVEKLAKDNKAVWDFIIGYETGED